MDWETKLALDDIHDAMEKFEKLSVLAMQEAENVGAWNGCKSLRQTLRHADAALLKLKLAIGKLEREVSHAHGRIS